LAFREAGLPVEGGKALAAAAAVVVGAVEVERAQDADDVAFAVAVVRGGAIAVGARHAGPLVAIFFRARCCS
jgi:hypothetical protein